MDRWRDAERLMPERAARGFGEMHDEGRQDEAEERAGRHIAQRLGAHARRVHVGRRDAHLLRRVHAHAEDEQREEFRKIAARRVRMGLVLAEIGEKAGITIANEEVSRAVMARAQQFPG